MRGFSRNKLPTSRGDDSDLVRFSALDDAAGVEHEMAPCWQCSQVAGRRISVKKAEVQPNYAAQSLDIRVECHGETAHITLKGIDPARFERGYNPNRQEPGGLSGLEYSAINNIPFFTPHPEHELDFGEVRSRLVAIVKAGEKRMQNAERAAAAIRRGLT